MPLQPQPFCASIDQLCRLACTCLLLLAAVPGCSEFTGERSSLPIQTSLASFGANARIRAEISPGKVLCARHPSAGQFDAAPTTSELCTAPEDGGPQDPFVTVLRASAPLPVLLFDNGENTPKQFRVRLTNARADLRTSAVLLPLRSTAPRATACPESAANATYLTPPPELRRSPTEREWQITVPPCSSVSIRQAWPEDHQGTFRLLVAGPNASDDAALDTVIAEANNWPADHIHFLGGMLDANATEPAARLLSLVEPRITVPYSISLGDAERTAGRNAFYDRFGPADLSSLLGNVRLLMLDTSNGELSLDQLDFVDGLAAAPAGAAFLFHAPSVPAAISPEGLVSPERSLRLVELLRAKGIRNIFSVSDRADTSDIDGANLFQLTDPADDSDANYARVLITDLDTEVPHLSVELFSAR